MPVPALTCGRDKVRQIPYSSPLGEWGAKSSGPEAPGEGVEIAIGQPVERGHRSDLEELAPTPVHRGDDQGAVEEVVVLLTRGLCHE